MIFNYLKTAWRNFVRHKLFSAINIIGLGIGLAVCMIILLYVEHEHSYDRFHKNAGRIVWIHSEYHFGNDSFDTELMSYATAPLSKQYLPNVLTFTRTENEYQPPTIWVISSIPEKHIEKSFLFADSNFFQIFSFKMLKGNPSTALSTPFSLVISQTMAKKYFGEANPLGRQLSFNGKYIFTVTGVVENPPSNSSIQYGLVGSLSSYSRMSEKQQELESHSVHNGSFMTYFLLKNPFMISQLEDDLASLQKLTIPDLKNPDRFIVTPLTKIHLSNIHIGNENLKYLTLFPFIAALILLLALTNYISLSTAAATIRAKEIGIRKVIGADGKAIAFQFLLESAAYTTVAFFVGYIFYYFFQVRFFQYLQLSIDYSFLTSTRQILSLVLLYLTTVLLASVYPAILLSAFKPVKVLYGKFLPNTRGLSFRKFITVFQFSISVSMIICAIVIHQQVYFFRTTYTGVNRDNVLMIPFSQTIGNNYHAFQSEIASISGIKNVAVNHYQMYGGYDILNAHSNEDPNSTNLSVFNVDTQFIRLMEMKWNTQPDDLNYDRKERQIVLNVSAMNALHLKPGILHQTIIIGDNDRLELAGIVQDFNFESLKKKIGPMGLYISKDSSGIWSEMNGCLFVKVNAKAPLPLLIKRIKNVYEIFDKIIPFSYTFLDDAFNGMYIAEERLSQLFSVFVLISVIIASMGLFGLTTFIASRRIKEIVLRKILGASIIQIVHLLIKDFLKLVLLAWIISCPIALICMHAWLESFAFKINLTWWMFASGGLIGLMISLMTIGFQSVRTAAMNLTNSLRLG